MQPSCQRLGENPGCIIPLPTYFRTYFLSVYFVYYGLSFSSAGFHRLLLLFFIYLFIHFLLLVSILFYFSNIGFHLLLLLFIYFLIILFFFTGFLSPPLKSRLSDKTAHTHPLTRHVLVRQLARPLPDPSASARHQEMTKKTPTCKTTLTGMAQRPGPPFLVFPGDRIMPHLRLHHHLHTLTYIHLHTLTSHAAIVSGPGLD